MKIVFIGAGNLATRLGVEMSRKGFSIGQVYSRTIESASVLAKQLGCEATNNIADIRTDAGLYIFSVKDDVLPDLLKQMPPTNGIWVHTAGSVPMDIFKGYNDKYGVVYPFQTFSKNREVDFSIVPFFLEADSDETMNALKTVFSALSKKQMELSSEKRKYLHLTGVFACNFVNHLYAVSQDILAGEGIPFEYLLPLIDETAAKVHDMPPAAAQTGPAVRYDRNVIEKHLSLLEDKRLKEIYTLISESIYEKAKNNQP